MDKETLDHRERRLAQIWEAVERHLDEGWVYWLILGKPGDQDSVNIVSNSPPQEAEQIVETMLKVVKERYTRGERPKEL